MIYWFVYLESQMKLVVGVVLFGTGMCKINKLYICIWSPPMCDATATQYSHYLTIKMINSITTWRVFTFMTEETPFTCWTDNIASGLNLLEYDHQLEYEIYNKHNEISQLGEMITELRILSFSLNLMRGNSRK